MLARFGLRFDLCIRHHQLAPVTELVQACPEVVFMLDHLGKPDVKSRTAGDQYLAVAVFYLLNGKADNVKDYKVRALRNAPYLQDEADRLLPADL